MAYSMRQKTIKPSIYGSEMVAMRIARYSIADLRIKLKMFGKPLQDQKIELTVSKKHNSIYYHDTFITMI